MIMYLEGVLELILANKKHSCEDIDIFNVFSLTRSLINHFQFFFLNLTW
jgi:hypothetical protein